MVFDKFQEMGDNRKVKKLKNDVALINSFEPEMEELSDEQLRGKTEELKRRLADGRTLDDIMHEAFAAVREASRRTLGQRHYDVQLMGGVVLHQGGIAEMRTGEGKTLVSTLPTYLNALGGEGVHLVTVNDYLAKRDSEWMSPIFRLLGASVGLIQSNMRPEQRRPAYAADITYGTNNEFGFDYLRDNMAMRKEHMVQRGHHYGIVDEVDSILVDEARTPLIISGPVQDSQKWYTVFARLAPKLKRDEDYEVEEGKRTVAVTEKGVARVEEYLNVDNLYEHVHTPLVHHLQNAIRAKELYKRDVEYVVTNGEVKIVDEFTGRILEGRRWSEGLHQAVEAKERVKIKEENQTLATITLQNYFRMYDKLAGMTGTAETEAGEFAHTYDMPVVPIPTHRPMVRADQGDLIYKTEEGKFAAVVEDLAERYERGQPVLVGTVSVEKSERLSTLLDRRGIPHAVLNAKHHTKEAQIVAQAGRLHTITVATNMAGRGVDILLGGYPEGLARQQVLSEGLDPDTDEGQARYRALRPEYEAECGAEGDKVRELGGLYVLGTERHESRRIDNQLRGRSGRQGDPGESRFYLSLEDDLMRLFATGAMAWVMGKALPEDVPIEAKMVTKAIERAQTTVEARNAEIRKNVLKYDEVMNEQRKVIYRRRQQILDGRDLRDEVLEQLKEAVEHTVQVFCATPYPEEWDLVGLLAELLGYYPTRFSVDDLRQAATPEQITESVLADAVAHYEEKEGRVGADTMRELERRVVLSIIDQRWREHLYEMDYLQEGINLRAMGQRDPLTEWQREGHEMFSQMMAAIDDDFVRYVLHAEVAVEAPRPSEPAVRNVQYSAPEDPSQAPSGFQRAAVAEAAAMGEVATAAPEAMGNGQVADDLETQAPIVKSEWEKTGRNQPCPCGSGKKFKLCHGA